MLRRFSQPVAGRTPLAATTISSKRNYTDYVHFKYPVSRVFVFGFMIYQVSMWFLHLSQGSVWWKKNREWKRDVARTWTRRMGTGYKWSNDFGPELEHMFKNIPKGVVE